MGRMLVGGKKGNFHNTVLYCLSILQHAYVYTLLLSFFLKRKNVVEISPKLHFYRLQISNLLNAYLMFVSARLKVA